MRRRHRRRRYLAPATDAAGAAQARRSALAGAARGLRVMRTALLLALVLGCYGSGGGERDAPVDSSGIADAAPSGCNPATGMGCLCGTCPQPTDTCITTISSGDGGWCSNRCTVQDQATTCALLPGQP